MLRRGLAASDCAVLQSGGMRPRCHGRASAIEPVMIARLQTKIQGITDTSSAYRPLKADNTEPESRRTATNIIAAMPTAEITRRVRNEARSVHAKSRSILAMKFTNHGPFDGSCPADVRQYCGKAKPINSITPLNAARARTRARQPVTIAVSFAVIIVDVRHGSMRSRLTVRSSTSPANAIAVAATTKNMQIVDDNPSDMPHGADCKRKST